MTKAKAPERRYFIVSEVSFIGGSMLAPGSRVTSDDLGEYKDPTTGEMTPVTPGTTLIETDENGELLDDERAEELQQVLGGLRVGASTSLSVPPTAPGGARLAQNNLVDAPGGDNEAEAVLAMTAGQPSPEAPKRRG